MTSSALYAIGALGHRDHIDPALAEDISTRLVARLDAARQEDEVVMVLDAMANHGGRSLLDAIRVRLDDPRPPVRASAFRALRRMSGTEVEATLRSAFADEPARVARLAALKTLADWSSPEVATLEWACTQLPAVKTTQEGVLLVDFLGGRLDRYAEGESTLRTLLTASTPLAIRHRIYRYLAPTR